MSGRRAYGAGRTTSVSIAALIAAAEAIACGDVRLAESILAGLLLEAEPRRASSRRVYCPCCGNDYPFPGLLDVHRLRCSCDEVAS